MSTMPTQMAGLRGIGRINEHQRDTSGVGLIGHELPQLVEAPTVVVVALWLANPCPLTDARQIFQGNLPLCCLRLLDKSFTDRMVDRSHMALLAVPTAVSEVVWLLSCLWLGANAELWDSEHVPG